MRAAHLCVGLLFLGCAHSSAPTPQTAPRPGTVSARVVYVDSATADSLRKAHPPTPQMERFHRATDSLAALVDTIVVLYPDSIVLHVGQASGILDSLRIEGRRSSGEVVRGAGFDVRVENMSVALPGEAGLTGRREGRTRIVLQLIRSGLAGPPRPPFGYILVVVVP